MTEKMLYQVQRADIKF